MCDPIGGLVSAVGGLTGGNSSAKTDRKQTLKGYGQMGDVYDTMRKIGGSRAAEGAAARTAGAAATGDASKYYSEILSGNPTAVSAAAAPEINAVTSQANQEKKQLSNFGNRTGGKTAAMTSLSAGTRGTIADTIAKKRAGAAAGKERVGSQQTGAGLSEGGQELSAEEAAGQTASNLTSISSENRKTSQAIHDQAVSDWGDAIAQILLPDAG